MTPKILIACAALVAGGVFPSVVVRAELLSPGCRVIAAGDLLNLRVVESGEGACLLPVSPSGEIEVPRLGRVAVAGKKTEASAGEIKGLLEKNLYFSATVLLSIVEPARALRAADPRPVDPQPAEAPQNRPPSQVTVVGRVRRQGSQDMPTESKYYLSQAIIKAGGVAMYGNARRIQVVRKTEDGKRERFTADVQSVLREQRIENDVELQPGDMIIVPEKLLNL